jgi:hypothetical protein
MHDYSAREPASPRDGDPHALHAGRATPHGCRPNSGISLRSLGAHRRRHNSLKTAPRHEQSIPGSVRVAAPSCAWLQSATPHQHPQRRAGQGLQSCGPRDAGPRSQAFVDRGQQDSVTPLPSTPSFPAVQPAPHNSQNPHNQPGCAQTRNSGHSEHSEQGHTPTRRTRSCRVEHSEVDLVS